MLGEQNKIHATRQKIDYFFLIQLTMDVEMIRNSYCQKKNLEKALQN